MSSAFGATEKSTRQMSTLRRFLQYVHPYRKQVPIALLCVLIGAASQAVGPFVIGQSTISSLKVISKGYCLPCLH
jgi:ATP-binding cassette, subfamily B, multidrug efflux pump